MNRLRSKVIKSCTKCYPKSGKCKLKHFNGGTDKDKVLFYSQAGKLRKTFGEDKVSNQSEKNPSLCFNLLE